MVLVSETDRQRCERERPQRRTIVVPNGVDCDAFRPPEARYSGPPTIVFSGDMSFQPNVDAAEVLAREIFPRLRRRAPEARLRLVGRKPDPRVQALAGDAVEVTGAVPKMQPYLEQARAARRHNEVWLMYKHLHIPNTLLYISRGTSAGFRSG